MPDDVPAPKSAPETFKQKPDKVSAPKPTPELQSLDILKTYQDITQHAREEFNFVRAIYKYATVPVIVCVFLIGFLGYRSFDDFRKKIEENVNALGDAVNKRVEKEFETENIKRLVETKAKERIDLIADTLIKAAVSNRVTPIRDEIIARLKTITEGIKKDSALLDQRLDDSEKAEREIKGLLKQADETLVQVRQQSEFILTVLSGQSDDRKAYDQLGVWENDSSFPLRYQAAKARLSIQKSYAGMFANKTYRPINLTGEDLGKMTFSEITNLWQTTPSDGACAYIYLVWDLTNITKNQKRFFLYDILSDSRNSLQAGDLAASILAQEGNIPYTAPLNFGRMKDLLKDWIISNAAPSNATNKPVAPVVPTKQ